MRVKVKRQNENKGKTKDENFEMIKSKRRERYEQWKNRMKNNPDKLEKFKRKDAANHRQARRDMSDEKRITYNVKARERMRKYRERKRISGENASEKKTIHQIKEQRHYWREKKRKQRSKDLIL